VRQARTGRHVPQLPGEVDGSEPDTDAGWRLPPNRLGDRRSPSLPPGAGRPAGFAQPWGTLGVKPHDG